MEITSPIFPFRSCNWKTSTRTLYVANGRHPRTFPVLRLSLKSMRRPASNRRPATILGCRWCDYADPLQRHLSRAGTDVPRQRVHGERAELLEPETDRRGRVAGQARRAFRAFRW